MEKTVNIHAAKRPSGKAVVRLVPVKRKKVKRPNRKPGFLKGKIRIGSDFDDPLPENILEAFRGERD